MNIDRICFYLDDAVRWRHWFVEQLGWRAIAAQSDGDTQWETVRCGGVTFDLGSPLTARSPVAAYLRAHPPGVAEIVLNVADVGVIAARARQARSASRGRVRLESPAGTTFILQTATSKIASDGWAAAIDHVVLNVAMAEFAPTIAWFERVLGLERQQSFEVRTPRSGLVSQVMVHPESGLRLPLNAPTSATSQIQEFLECNRGPGVQHVALATPEILATVRRLRRAGLAFLEVPDRYYEGLFARHPELPLGEWERQAVRTLRVLVDCPQARTLLLQIFTQPLFPRPTFFLELIERRGNARGFGEGNFRALFEAIEREQMGRL